MSDNNPIPIPDEYQSRSDEWLWLNQSWPTYRRKILGYGTGNASLLDVYIESAGFFSDWGPDLYGTGPWITADDVAQYIADYKSARIFYDHFAHINEDADPLITVYDGGLNTWLHLPSLYPGDVLLIGGGIDKPTPDPVPTDPHLLSYVAYKQTFCAWAVNIALAGVFFRYYAVLVLRQALNIQTGGKGGILASD